MLGQMMNVPLTITQIMRFAERLHGDTEIVSISAGAARHRCTYRDVFRRAERVANGLATWRLAPGDRVATLAWNDHRHLELYYGVSCAGYVLHTINPRLFPDQIQFIIQHAQDRVLFFDPAFLPLIESLAPSLTTIERFVLLAPAQALPESRVPGLVSYEAWLDAQSPTFDWPDLDEQAASALCYTSGTTGQPKGVLYSHRSTVLHAWAACVPNAMGLSSDDVVLPVVPMFHVHAWGMPYAAPMAGAKLVFAGPAMGSPSILHELIRAEAVTLALGVPTVWIQLLAHLAGARGSVPTLRRVIVGGAACPEALMQGLAALGVEAQHAWGMTEMSPTGTVNVPRRRGTHASGNAIDALRLKQGRPPFGVELRIVDGAGQELPWDGRASGELQARGPWVCDRYYGEPSAPRSDGADGWFSTGDVATIDATGCMQITDRSKDVIKSGGEWISSIALENIAAAHPDVLEAAVIGISHEKWSERPLLIVAARPGTSPDADNVLATYDGRVPAWWIPDAVEFVDALPHTATGKVSKKALRERFGTRGSRSAV
jgi:acyl-CoA synthetase (AMP-forming)/AMP-acid ligase II